MYNYISKHKQLNILIFIITISTSLGQVLGSMSLSPILNNLVNRNIQGIVKWSFISLLIWIATLLLGYISSVLEEHTIKLMSNDIRTDFAKNISRMSITDYEKNDKSHYVSWMNNDVQIIQDNGFRSLYNLTGNMTTIIFAIGSLIYYHYSLAIVALIFSLFLVVLPKGFSTIMEKQTLRIKSTNSTFLEKIDDILGGFSVFSYHNCLTIMTQKVNDESEILGTQKVNYIKTIGALNTLISFVSVLSQIFMMFFTATLAYLGVITIGVITTSGNLSGLIFTNLSQVSTNLFSIKSVKPILKQNLTTSRLKKGNQTQKIDHFTDTIRLENVSFSYGNKPVLRNVSYIFEKGKKYAIIGDSGSGKSTLLKILLKRLNPDTGTVYIDQKNYTELSESSITNLMEYVEQRPYLFNETIKNNISLNTKTTNEHLLPILTKLGIHDFAKLSDKIIGHGNNFSGGQRQRIALARALNFSKNIIFLDEVTSGLDKQSSQEIETILLSNPSVTVVMITHHLSDETKNKLDGILEVGI
ncbi:ATP-binding cassette domain-containing protein [Carnobacterium inhibens]|uniref:ABC transporter permease n=2 Tax=Carnobacterium inhibens TaxID=147709 RepID=U5SCB2_9LACT|nr:ABC transporter ATP-binding protein [Carnobacterium inhibens]AGY82939.1 ABC transporter permease [Carnobacterium inhibens subsp. gilichinskyi]MBC9826230.1 ATP-binding cassette domain-containing protein [Carnobacterium inhibens]